MNKLFNTKLEKVQELSKSVSEHKNDIEKIETDIAKKLKNVEELENSLREATKKLEMQEEINNFQETENNYLKEQVKLTITLTRFQSVILRIEEHLTKINENVIKSSKWGSEKEDPIDDFEWSKRGYLDAKDIYEHYGTYSYESELVKLQYKAKKNKVGLWSGKKP